MGISAISDYSTDELRHELDRREFKQSLRFRMIGRSGIHPTAEDELEMLISMRDEAETSEHQKRLNLLIHNTISEFLDR